MRDMEWGKAIRNGLLSCLLGLLICLIPVVLAAFWLEAGAGRDLLTTGRELTGKVGDLYRGNWPLIAAILFISVVIVVWRAWAVANRTGPWRLANGLLVGLVPALLWLLFVLFGGFDPWLMAMAAVFILAGLMGGILARA